MYLLDTKQFGEFNLDKAKEFVDFWSNYYKNSITIFGTKERISYIDELSLRGELTEENIRRLLRWKDPRMLTQNHEKRNKKVQRVLDRRKDINEFRFSEKSELDFREDARNIFPSGFIWPIFLFHIARPFQYPIGDQNVFRAYFKMTKKKIPTCWEEYLDYKEYFFEISLTAGVIAFKPAGDEKNITKIVEGLKKVDEALFIFGKFIKSYGESCGKEISSKFH
jgi:hypothetical protein